MKIDLEGIQKIEIELARLENFDHSNTKLKLRTDWTAEDITMAYSRHTICQTMFNRGINGKK